MKSEHGGNIYKYKERMYDFSANLNPLGMPRELILTTERFAKHWLNIMKFHLSK